MVTALLHENDEFQNKKNWFIHVTQALNFTGLMKTHLNDISYMEILPLSFVHSSEEFTFFKRVWQVLKGLPPL